MSKKNTYSGRSILLALGVGEVQATLALSKMMLTPSTSDPDSGATVVIVKAVQRALGLPTNGLITKQTASRIRQVIGPNWESVQWMQITEKLVHLKDSSMLKFSNELDVNALGDVSFGQKAGGLLIIGGALYLALKFRSPFSG